ncbi:MAG: hypothetical protein CME32_22420, partial [Gimesia sp.]|nr:hypothetical protein [Gimesia sp.]
MAKGFLQFRLSERLSRVCGWVYGRSVWLPTRLFLGLNWAPAWFSSFSSSCFGILATPEVDAATLQKFAELALLDPEGASQVAASTYGKTERSNRITLERTEERTIMRLETGEVNTELHTGWNQEGLPDLPNAPFRETDVPDVAATHPNITGEGSPFEIEFNPITGETDRRRLEDQQ